MKKIFWGLFLVLIGVTVDVGGGVVKILPDVAGYLVVTAGLMGLAKEEPAFAGAIPACKGMVIISTGFLAFQLLIPYGAYPAAVMAVYALYGIAGYYFMRKIVMEIRYMEEKREADLKGRQMEAALAVFLISYLCANLILIPLAVLAAAVALLAAKIAFLVFLYRSVQLCRKAVPPLEG